MTADYSRDEAPEPSIWRNSGLAAEIREALDQAERGETVNLGSFAQYDTRDDDED